MEANTSDRPGPQGITAPLAGDASNLLSRGVPLPAVSAHLGHADVNITARINAHALPDDDRRAADTWDSVVADDGLVTGPVQ